MSAQKSREIDVLLDDAERRGSCLVANGKSLTRALERRAAEGELVCPWPRLYARTGSWDALPSRSERTLHILRGLHELHPDWVFCGPSAALLHGLSVSYRLQDEVHVAVGRKGYLADGTGVVRHAVPRDEAISAGGAPATPLLRTTFDCARWLPFREGVAVADAALRGGDASHDELVGYADGMRGGYRGVERARLVASFADARAENGGESVARAAMWELGFARPELQVEVPSPFSGSGVYRVDFRWRLPDGSVLYGEHDGGEKYVNPQMNGGSALGALRAERMRESRLTLERAAIVRFSPANVADTAFFDWLLLLYGVPKDHAPLTRIPQLAPVPPPIELVPAEAYALS